MFVFISESFWMGVDGDAHTHAWWITFWNAMASTALLFFSFTVFVVSLSSSIFVCVSVCASVEIWPSLLLALPRISSYHKRREEEKYERGPLIQSKCCCNWNLIRRPTCAPLRAVFYMLWCVCTSHNVTWCACNTYPATAYNFCVNAWRIWNTKITTIKDKCQSFDMIQKR